MRVKEDNRAYCKKKDFIDKLSNKSGLDKKVCEHLIKHFIDTTRELLVDGYNFRITNFLTFEIVTESKKIRKLNGKVIHVPEKQVPLVKMSKNYKKSIIEELNIGKDGEYE